MAGPDDVVWTEEIDVQDFRFRELRKINFGDPGVEGCDDQRFSLLCISNHFGLTFVGCKTGVYVFRTALLYEVDKDEHLGKRNMMAGKSNLGPTHVPTPAPPINISLSSDSLTLSVYVKEDGLAKIYFYDTRALSNKGMSVQSFCNITLSTDKAARLMDLQWNPSPDYATLLIVVLSTGIVQVLEVKDDVSVLVKREGLQANCVCWSPKGKQFALGMKNGDVVQCAPKNFEEKRRYHQPKKINPDDKLSQVSDLYWLSSFEFIVTYIPQDQNTLHTCMAFMSTPKDKPVSFNCADDPYAYYGVNTNKRRVDKFLFSCITKWGVLVTCSNNSIDLAQFGRDKGDHGVTGVPPCDNYQGSWWQWSLDEGGRAGPPVHSDDSDTFTVGMGIDYTSQEVVPINDSTILPCSPLFLLYTDRGVLCPYIIINTSCSPDKIAELVTVPKPLPNAPIRQPVKQTSQPPPAQPPQHSIASASQALPKTVTPQISAPPFSRSSQASTPFTTSVGQPPSFPFLGGVNKPLGQLPGYPGGGPLGTAPTRVPPFASQNSQIGSGSLGFVQAAQLPQQNLSGALTGPASTSAPSPGAPALGLGQSLRSTAEQSTGPKLSSGLSMATSSVGSMPFSFPVPSDPAKTSAVVGPSSSQLYNPGALSLSTGKPPASFSQGPAPPANAVNAPTTNAGLSASSLQRGDGLSLSMAPQSGLHQKPPLGGVQPHNTSTPVRPLSVPSAGGLGMPLGGTSGLRTSGPPMPAASVTPQSGLPPMSMTQARPPPMSTPQARPPLVAALPSQPPLTTKQPLPSTIASCAPQTRPMVTMTPATPIKPAHPPSVDQERVEKQFANHIQNEIDNFSEEIDQLQEEILSLVRVEQGGEDGRVEGLGTGKELTDLTIEINMRRDTMREESKKFKVIEQCSELVTEETLHGFEVAEEVRTWIAKKEDPKFISLLNMRPLDSYSTKRLNSLRASFLEVSRAVDEINSQLDTQLEKKHEERRQRGRNLLKAPSIQTVYSTLKDQHRIIRLQSDSMSDIVSQMKRLRLIPKSWQPTTTKSISSSPRKPDLTPPTDGFQTTPRDRERERTPVRPVDGEKMEKLREYLYAIEKTPVKKVEKVQTPLFRARSQSISQYSSEDTTDAPPVVQALFPTQPYVAQTLVPTQHPPSLQSDSRTSLSSQEPPSSLQSDSLTSSGSHKQPASNLQSHSGASFGSHKPALIVSPDRRTVGILAKQNGRSVYEKISQPASDPASERSTPQLSRQSSGLCMVAASADRKIYVKEGNKYELVDDELAIPPSQTTAHSTGDPGHMTSGAGHLLSRQSSDLCMVAASADRKIYVKEGDEYKLVDDELAIPPPHTTAHSTGDPGHVTSGAGHMPMRYGHMTSASTQVKSSGLPASSHYSTGTGTIHWGSPPSKTESQPQTKVSVCLASTLTATNPPLSQATPTRGIVDLGELRRTSPHSDLSQIRPPSTEDFPSFPHTSLSVPNIAPTKPLKQTSSALEPKTSVFGSSPHMPTTGKPPLSMPSSSIPANPLPPLSVPSSRKLPTTMPPSSGQPLAKPPATTASRLVSMFSTPFPFQASPSVMSGGSAIASAPANVLFSGFQFNKTTATAANTSSFPSVTSSGPTTTSTPAHSFSGFQFASSFPSVTSSGPTTTSTPAHSFSGFQFASSFPSVTSSGPTTTLTPANILSGLQFKTTATAASTSSFPSVTSSGPTTTSTPAHSLSALQLKTITTTAATPATTPASTNTTLSQPSALVFGTTTTFNFTSGRSTPARVFGNKKPEDNVVPGIGNQPPSTLASDPPKKDTTKNSPVIEIKKGLPANTETAKNIVEIDKAQGSGSEQTNTHSPSTSDPVTSPAVSSLVKEPPLPSHPPPQPVVSAPATAPSTQVPSQPAVSAPAAAPSTQVPPQPAVSAPATAPSTQVPPQPAVSAPGTAPSTQVPPQPAVSTLSKTDCAPSQVDTVTATPVSTPLPALGETDSASSQVDTVTATPVSTPLPALRETDSASSQVDTVTATPVSTPLPALGETDSASSQVDTVTATPVSTPLPALRETGSASSQVEADGKVGVSGGGSDGSKTDGGMNDDKSGAGGGGGGMSDDKSGAGGDMSGDKSAAGGGVSSDKSGASGGMSGDGGGMKLEEGEVINSSRADGDDDAMMADDMEPIDDSTGQNQASVVPMGGLSVGPMQGFGLGKPTPTNMTANPFGTPSSSIIASPPGQSGLLRSSAFGVRASQPASMSMLGGGTTFSQSSPMGGQSMFGQKAFFGSPSTISASNTAMGQSMVGGSMFSQKPAFGSPPTISGASTAFPAAGKVFGSGGSSGGGNLFRNQQISGAELTFGGLASSGTSSGLGARGLSGTEFGTQAGNSSGSGQGNFSGGNFSGWR